MNILRRIGRWFCLEGAVGRQEYLLTGLCLMVFKYAVESLVIASTTGKFYSPLDFFNPLISVRSEFIVGGPDWLGMAWVLWTIPFVWIAVAMSTRRAVDAGASPWVGMFVLVPILNFFFMLYLSWIPENYAQRHYWKQPQLDSTVEVVPALSAALYGIAIGVIYLLTLTLLSVNIFHSYGAAVFFGTPIVTGAVSAYVYNRQYQQKMSNTLGHTAIVVVVFAVALLLFGLEGILCIVMAIPIVLPCAFLGALVGRAIASHRNVTREKKENGLLGGLLILPMIAGIEGFITPRTEFEVLSVVEVAASPEHVWQCVVSFPEITEDPEWFFRLGISCPQGARIEGEGVDPTRYCDFTTGSFVEPVTVWDPPRVLAFDVTKQPDPMTELSPYRHIHPPHLDGSFRSTHGEFRLIPLADGRTRLEGRTWYQLEIYPHSYWTLWTDWLIHKIHGRVLRHIKQLAEREQA